MLDKILDKWDEILLNIKEEHDITDVSYKTWLLPLKPYSVDKDILTILVPDDLFLNYVKKKYEFLLKFTIEEVTGISCEIRFLLKDSVKEETSEKKLIQNNTTAVSQIAIQNANLNPRYTFDTFVVGKNNNLAHAASLAVAESPGEIYNPLFIYGGVGLGKTHLMHSVAHFILKNNPNAKILYVTSEKFTNELIDAIRNKNNFSTTEFREKYRNNDVLLIDDIQFIIGKESTQEEFFHTFNALYEAKKQIVLTSDRPPKEINTLEDRMKTRFEWGLLADIQPPDFETRIAIIRDKAVKMGVELPDDVSNYIAENIQANIRQLEGAVKKIKAMHELMGERITVSLAENAIDALRTENPGLNPTPERIMEAVANYFYIPVEQMISQNRSKDVAYPRQMAMYMIRQELEYSFPDIAKIFKRDHTTVMHACNKIEEERKNSRETEDVIKKLHNNIRGDG